MVRYLKGCDGLNNGPQRCLSQPTRTCEHVTLHGKGDPKIVDQVKDPEMGKLSWIIRIASMSLQGLMRGKQKGQRKCDNGGRF